MQERTVELRVNRALVDDTVPGGLSPLGLVIAEHIDKLSFFEPALLIREKAIGPDTVRITLAQKEPLTKPLAEIIRGFKIGCFKIAREYHLISPQDTTPLFKDGFTETRDRPSL